MIKVLKETPITVEGKDYCLQLLHDDTLLVTDACDYCYYRDWFDVAGIGASCVEVHGCLGLEPTYFKLTDLLTNPERL